MPQKLPPPPPFAEKDPVFNRWLLELTAILNDSGGIDPDSITGLPELFTQVDQNTADILTLQATQGVQSFDILLLQGRVGVLEGQVVTINGQITSLGARGELLFGTGAPAGGLGKVNDWYGDTAGAVGARIWIKKAVGVWTPFPF